MVESLTDNADKSDVDGAVEDHRSTETHDTAQPPQSHALGGGVHSASTRAAINALVSDATLESEQGAQGRVDNHTATEVHDEPQPPAGKGEPNGVAELNDAGVLRSGQVPALAISETFIVTNEADLTTLDATVGDVAIVTSQSQAYICTGDPSDLANWSEIQSPAPPVQDVFGRTGSVNPQSGDYSASQITDFNSTAADAAPVQTVNGEQGDVTVDSGAPIVSTTEPSVGAAGATWARLADRGTQVWSHSLHSSNVNSVFERNGVVYSGSKDNTLKAAVSDPSTHMSDGDEWLFQTRLVTDRGP